TVSSSVGEKSKVLRIAGQDDQRARSVPEVWGVGEGFAVREHGTRARPAATPLTRELSRSCHGTVAVTSRMGSGTACDGPSRVCRETLPEVVRGTLRLDIATRSEACQ